jgi:sigma-B regulation protein RsbU (phosphoserine phosphatase)
MIGVIPPVVISHVTLHQITEIKNGHQSIDNFLAQMPLAIFFLLGLSMVLAVILSLFLARSVSIPLRKTTLGMRRIGRGHLEARVKVVSCDEIGSMGEGFNVMAEGLRERDYIRQTFGSYLSDDVVTEILESPDGVKLGGEMRNISILVSDLRGFTPLAESLEPSKVIEILNRYFERMTDVILRHNGTIDEFTGDGILVFFGAPKPLKDHEMVSVACALEMRKALKEMNRENNLLNLPELRMGIGINAGQVIVGNLGSEKRKKYGAVGSPINIAFRVESLTGKDEILITPSVYGQRLEQLELGAVKEATLKGFETPIALRSVIAIK